MKQRLQKILSQAGIASRRASEKLIVEGRIMINGNIVNQLGAAADPDVDSITIDGKPLHKEELVYLLLNKPKGYICSLKDPLGRRTVRDLLRGVQERVYPVGRLDYNSEGLLIFTNDGDLAHALMHPSGKVKKQYLVKVHGILSERDIKKIRSGVFLSEGRTQPAKLKVLKKEANSWVQMTISEGKKNQIRRIFQQLRHPVMKLRRTAYGFLKIGHLKTGMYRFLTKAEVDKMKRLLNITK